MLWAIAGTLVAAYAAILILMFVFQSHLVYFPVRAVAETPASRGLPFEEAQLTASDGTRLAAWFIPAPNPTGVVLFCHGNAGNISHRLDVAAFFRGLGLSTLLFDYRGYGRSEGRPTEAGTYLDADAAWRHLAGERRLPRRQIIVWANRSAAPSPPGWPGSILPACSSSSPPSPRCPISPRASTRGCPSVCSRASATARWSTCVRLPVPSS